MLPAAAAAASIALAEEWPNSNKINTFEKFVIWKSGEVHNVSLKSSLIAHILVHLLLIPTLFIISIVWQTNTRSQYYNCTHEIPRNKVDNFKNNMVRVCKYVIIFYTRVQNIAIWNSAVTVNISEINILLHLVGITITLRWVSYYETCWAEFLLFYAFPKTEVKEICAFKNLKLISYYKGLVGNGAAPCPSAN